MVTAIANGEDTAEPSKKIPFIRAKDAAAELARVKSPKDGDALLRKILTSLAKGRADDQKAVAAVAKELVEAGTYGPS